MPVAPGVVTMPSRVVVAASATISGVAAADEVKSKVLTPLIGSTTSPEAHDMRSAMSVSPNVVVGVMEITKVCDAPAAMFTGVFAVPIGALVFGSVV